MCQGESVQGFVVAQRLGNRGRSLVSNVSVRQMQRLQCGIVAERIGDTGRAQIANGGVVVEVKHSNALVATDGDSNLYGAGVADLVMGEGEMLKGGVFVQGLGDLCGLFVVNVAMVEVELGKCGVVLFELAKDLLELQGCSWLLLLLLLLLLFLAGVVAHATTKGRKLTDNSNDVHVLIAGE